MLHTALCFARYPLKGYLVNKETFTCTLKSADQFNHGEARGAKNVHKMGGNRQAQFEAKGKNGSIV